jgi:hypothetical protein
MSVIWSSIAFLIGNVGIIHVGNVSMMMIAIIFSRDGHTNAQESQIGDV